MSHPCFIATDAVNINRSVVYFIQFGDDPFVKIGITNNLKRRLNELQTSSPKELIILGTKHGGIKEERELHKKFKQHRIRREWFMLTNEIKHYIQNNTFPTINNLFDKNDFLNYNEVDTDYSEDYHMIQMKENSNNKKATEFTQSQLPCKSKKYIRTKVL